MAGSFEVAPFPEDDEWPYTIVIHLVSGVIPSPDDRILGAQIGDDLGLVNRVMAVLYPNARTLGIEGTPEYRKLPDFRSCYLGFLAAARVGIEHPNGDIETGRVTLGGARAEFVKSFGRKLRNIYLISMSKYAAGQLFIALLALVAALVIPRFETFSSIAGAEMALRAGAFALLGNALSIWLAAALYLQKLGWDKLDYLDPDGFPPLLRIGIVFVLTVVLMILLGQDVLILGLSNVMLNKFMESPGISLLIGLLCGLSEVRVTELVQRVFSQPTESAPPAAKPI